MSLLCDRHILNGAPLNEFFFKYKFPEDVFGIASISKQQLLNSRFKTDAIINRYIPCWFDVDLHEAAPLKEIWLDDRHLYYPKLLYLTDEYLKNNKQFNNLLNVYYDRRNERWEVHPGLGRKFVYLLFGPERLKCTLLNNSNETIIFETVFNSNEELLNYMKMPVYISVVPDHGSLIPEIGYNNESVDDILANVELYRRRLQQFWQTHELTHNMIINPPINHNIKADRIVNINVKNNEQDSLSKAMLLAPIITEDYHDDEISITIRKTH